MTQNYSAEFFRVFSDDRAPARARPGDAPQRARSMDAPPRARALDAPPQWRELDRHARRALARLLGGGTLRSVAPEITDNLRHLGLIEGDDQSAKLSRAGWAVLKSSREWLKAG